jgi:hypothetical protein
VRTEIVLNVLHGSPRIKPAYKGGIMARLVRRAPFTVLLGVLVSAACSERPVDYTPTAATAPSTDIFVGTLRLDGDRLEITDPLNITDRDGYDNQPYFVEEGTALLYTSARDSLQTDIYRYDIESGTVSRLTDTPAVSEYSPTVMPGGSFFSVIREEPGRQGLWLYRMNGSDAGGLLDDVQPVGYHAWVDPHTVAVFVLGDSITPSTLQLVDLRSGATSTVAENIGRSIHRVPERRAISFVHKANEDEWLIKAANVDTGVTTTVTLTLPGSEDYAWLSAGTIIMGSESTLYRSVDGGDWEVVADLADFGVSGISRVAVSAAGGRIATVSERGE